MKGTIRKNNNQEGGLLNFLGLLMRAGLPLMKIILSPLAKSVLMLLGLTAAGSVRNRCSYSKENLRMTTLIILSEEMDDIIKMVKSLEDGSLLIKGFIERLKMKQKNNKGHL